MRDLRVSVAHNVGTHDCEVREMSNAGLGSNHGVVVLMARYPHHFGSSWCHMVTTVCVNLITEGEASGFVAVGISKQWQWLQQPPHPFLA